MEILKYISGPLIGGIIGYFTNLIAVKMLFYPRREIRVFGHVLPFTPGAIPKGKASLAGAIGHAVADSLLTKDDIETILLSKETEDEIADAVMKHLSVRLSDEICILSGRDSEDYARKKASVSEMISAEIVSSIDIKAIMDEYGTEYMREKIHSKTLGKLVSNERIESIAASISQDLQAIVKERGAEFVQPIVKEKLDSIDSKSVEELLLQTGMHENTLRETVTGAYKGIVGENIDSLMSHLDIASMIAEKINAMPVEELERLIMSVMKRELNTIISLGALIGVLLGLLNIFLK